MDSLFEFRLIPKTLAVIGSRGYGGDVRYAMKASLRGSTTTIVSGGARGVDQAAEAYARALHLSRVSYRPTKYEGSLYGVKVWLDDDDWGFVPDQQRGDGTPWLFPDFRSAALRRNWWIANVSERMLALWDGDSTGTAHGIAAATRLGRSPLIWMEGDS